MKVKGCAAVMKWCLVVFNALIVCAGAIAIGLGAWGLSSEYGAREMKSLTGSELYQGAAIALIVGGCIMVVIAILGFLGALLENRVLLGIYFVIVLLLLILFVVAAAVAFAYRDTLEQEIKQQMNNTLLNQYGVNTSNNSDNSDATAVWDTIQTKLQCCGVEGTRQSDTGSWQLWRSSAWFRAQAQSNPQSYVPSSCCNLNVVDQVGCEESRTNSSQRTQYSIYYKGCYDQLKENIRQHILAIAGIAVAIVILMFLSILFAICVCAQIGRHKMDI